MNDLVVRVTKSETSSHLHSPKWRKNRGARRSLVDASWGRHDRARQPRPRGATVCAMEITPDGTSGNGQAESAAAVESTDAAQPAAAGWRWLLGLVGAEPLAVTAIVAAGVSVFGAPAIDLAVSSFLYSTDEPSQVWTYTPILVAAGIAVIVGLAGLYQGAAQRPSTWARALSGAGALIGLIVAIGTALVWVLAPDPIPYDELFPTEIGYFDEEPAG